MMGPNSVRRNLFHGNLSRRPASAGPPNGAVPPNPSNLANRPSHRLKPTSSDMGPSSRPLKTTENKEIVVKDRNGSYKLEVPTLPPPMIEEDGEELGELEGEAFDSQLSQGEKEKYEAALVEMVNRHRAGVPSDEPDELLNILNDSLRKKAASLDDDHWMFEPEKDSFLN
ncbi:uncharacterized protein N7511_007961 [Penicillium nucicola]|uniref:uncharacterized protein n=1 Tax=Penicillium nucicola TaxID=1850975 RepID=UPI00254548BD|nr:uncharacterized protein N7511_007961 [Penicillium nucicola]KAJ5753808.1 hypothetical protein N7511_007961 [Penicillium nucicola]